ncbi:dolichyl-P-Man:Man(5)GlcNAc(2)-PP-dolichyl mannosyltransferase [Plectosphaerella plurivora]|uniref:Dol-P-Man:Man(5)GlcNAc(2)-PP-Dol alpha-1,3-mannosyltransferase n=1 Tax=Plectosphaerella plurivora TaxID=936078 RepID=A0A9P9A7Z6_9PEZI|nr:dolichyl-P-Man:Man(5)GlcNAc(2)-PP-dolichyl mannosyltransferase [Plectosphaerella plurivora]
MASDKQPAQARSALGQLVDIANGRHKLSRFIPPALLAFDALLCIAVLFKVPYTEIDWKAYMEQVEQFVGGERDYAKIQGGTGPLVYPAAHVYLYTALYYVTDKGQNIFLAQSIFAVIYLATVATVMAVYRQGKAPPYLLPLLVLSKRLHSIFILRCFNDGLATLFLWLALYFVQRRSWAVGALLYSFGVGIKMSLLLSLPGLAVVLFLARGLGPSFKLAWLMAQVQIAIGVPFWGANVRSYLGRAFELSRQFLYKWTVNWRFVVLALFIITRWLHPAQKPLSAMIPAFLKARSPFTPLEEIMVSGYVTAKYSLTTVLTANLVGLLFARSLHYQFYAYLAWSTPYLLWRGGLPFPLIYLLWGAQEWAWNVYPSTDASSAVVVGIMALTVASVWFGTSDEELEIAPLPRPPTVKKVQPKDR